MASTPKPQRKIIKKIVEKQRKGQEISTAKIKKEQRHSSMGEKILAHHKKSLLPKGEYKRKVKPYAETTKRSVKIAHRGR